MLEKFMENCLPWVRLHAAAGEGFISLSKREGEGKEGGWGGGQGVFKVRLNFLLSCFDFVTSKFNYI